MEARRRELAYQAFLLEVECKPWLCVLRSEQLASEQSLSLLLLPWLALVPFQLHLEENLESQVVHFCGRFMNYYITF